MLTRPNIILIYTDEQRYDTLLVNGNRHIKTPNIDSLARNGVNFSHAFVSTPMCVPSRITLFTSRYSHVNSRYDNTKLLCSSEPDFVTVLREHGYRTGLAGKDHCFGETKDRAFSSYKLADHERIITIENDTDRKISAFRKGTMEMPLVKDPFPAECSITARVFDWAREFIDSQDDRPYFLWLSIPDPHSPNMVSEPYASMYEGVDIPLPVWSENEMGKKPYRQKLLRKLDRYVVDYPEDTDIQDFKRVYWGMISQIDDHVGNLMDFIEAQNQIDNTLVIFTSVHGDFLGDHKLLRKGPHLYDALTRVPLVFHHPAAFDAFRTDAMVSNIDLFPTIFALIGLKPPDWAQGESFDRVLTRENTEHREAVFLEHGKSGDALKPGEVSVEREQELRGIPHHFCEEVYRGKTKGVRTKKWKYCVTPGDVDELYDLEEDPWELSNLADCSEYRSIVDDMRTKILEWLVKTEYDEFDKHGGLSRNYRGVPVRSPRS